MDTGTTLIYFNNLNNMHSSNSLIGNNDWLALLLIIGLIIFVIVYIRNIRS